MTNARRLGLLGGTFDPIHVGHLDAAAAARRVLQLDEVELIPAHDPPHKTGDPHSSGFHRFALAALAINGYGYLRVSDIELRRTGPSYTAMTLRDLHEAGWLPSQLFFIAGSDAFAEIATWYDFPAVLNACNFAVISRPGTTLEYALAHTPQLRARIRRADESLGADSATAVYLVEAATRAVSSTEIRRRLAAHQPIAGLMPDAVIRHINVHHLYGTVDDLHDEE
jgi:nicotinate-nucleotide adenylyltransferase